ncbi:hypothetical protein D3C76_585270 [compost metagenome]|uniref:hypothetical protein n=1 Tax=Pseudomonas aeruginosa TaxID=287 RepID=UPI000F9C290E|nr:hypothetical protein [Pseudomonas aeruginosa]MCV3804651.1 hypothetical protein [Pseudomonas aeruginosa]MCV3846548.1 hypothetical protein [Pseudomonas aeruginosa]MCV3864699.1 hypothetical protein [Pseudomonas aeruginosa]MCV3984208.1 hypothetical protein [Pseudomonas aeruginosa]MCV3990258.1 hypothetical protein [Pseudomonas aeruginosa]
MHLCTFALMAKGIAGTLYIGGVKFGAVTVFDLPELDVEPAPSWPGAAVASMTIGLEYKGTKGKKAQCTNGKKLKRPLQK